MGTVPTSPDRLASSTAAPAIAPSLAPLAERPAHMSCPGRTPCLRPGPQDTVRRLVRDSAAWYPTMLHSLRTTAAVSIASGVAFYPDLDYMTAIIART